jgi:predicted Rossmann fold nucleotide-binding protein DprA/Smf involved in DNA uptake
MGTDRFDMEEKNSQGCRLRIQSGAEAVRGFAQIIDRLPPQLRAAYEDERRRRQSEFERYVGAHGYNT